MSDVVIYTKTGCPYCEAAKEQFQKEGVPFKEVNTSTDAEALAYIKQTLGAKKVPVIVRDGKLAEIGFQGGG